MKRAFLGVAAGVMLGMDGDAVQAQFETSSLTQLSLSEASQLVRSKSVAGENHEEAWSLAISVDVGPCMSPWGQRPRHGIQGQ